MVERLSLFNAHDPEQYHMHEKQEDRNDVDIYEDLRVQDPSIDFSLPQSWLLVKFRTAVDVKIP